MEQNSSFSSFPLTRENRLPSFHSETHHLVAVGQVAVMAVMTVNLSDEHETTRLADSLCSYMMRYAAQTRQNGGLYWSEKNSQHLHCVLYFKFLVYCTVMHPVRCTMCSILRKGGNRGSKGLHWFSIYCFSSCISVFCISHPEMRCGARACKILDSWGSGFGTPFVSADPSESMPPPESLIF